MGLGAVLGWVDGGQVKTNDPQLVTALTTEHFTLEGARSRTMSESAARASLFIIAVSSTLVALGFVTQLSGIGDVFNVFALIVLPTLYVLGAVTFVRMVECSAEDFRYGMAINRIRSHYKEIAGDRADLFLLSAHDDRAGVNANMALPRQGRFPVFAFSSGVAVINSVVGGAAIAVAIGASSDASLGIAATGGGIVALISLVGWLRYSDRLFNARVSETEPLYPSQ
jgi:hypothetical protein